MRRPPEFHLPPRRRWPWIAIAASVAAHSLLLFGWIEGRAPRLPHRPPQLIVLTPPARGPEAVPMPYRAPRAEGQAQALQTLFASAQLIDSKTMTLQVIDGLKALGASPSSKFVIPMEFTRLLGQVGDYLDQSLQGAERPARASANGEVQASLEPAGRP